jgi:hypothetical protein
VPFADFVKTTVLLSAGVSTMLAAITVLSVRSNGSANAATIGFAWWVLAMLCGIALGRRADASPPIARLLGGARAVSALPEQRPVAIILGRLSPLFLAAFVAGVLGVFYPQIPAIAAGFPIIWALAWRHQNGAVVAIERRDGVRFHVERASPLRPMTLTRTPGFKVFLPSEGRRAA